MTEAFATIVAIPSDDEGDVGDIRSHTPPPMANTTADDADYDELRDNESFVNQLRNDRVKDGKCPHCGTLLYEFKKKGVIRRKQVPKPLTVPGQAQRGQCLKCEEKAEAQIESDAAVALALMEEEASEIVAAVTITPIDDLPSQNQTADVTYKGEFMNGQRHGEGELKWSNGDKYVGTFWNGMREGEGTLHFADGSEYVGYWESNKMHGEGTRRFPNGNVYTGRYREGKRSGQGRCYYANGDMYVGEWVSDQMTGFGRYYYNNGQCFEGHFQAGRRNGFGKYQLTDGRVDIYRYENDKRVGEGVRWSSNRKKAWKLRDGKVQKKVNLKDASAIAKRIEDEGAAQLRRG